MPPSPLLINGRVSDSFGSPVSSATVSLVHSNGTVSVTTNSNGEYILNVGNLSSYSVGDSIAITTSKASVGRKTTNTTIPSSSTEINFTLEETSDLDYPEEMLNQHKLIFALPVGFDGEKISSSNPMPVEDVSKKKLQTFSGYLTVTSGTGEVIVPVDMNHIIYQFTISAPAATSFSVNLIEHDSGYTLVQKTGISGGRWTLYDPKVAIGAYGATQRLKVQVPSATTDGTYTYKVWYS